MRIGFLTHQFPGVRGGGIGTYTLQAAKLLAAAGHEPHVFTIALPADVRATIPAGEGGVRVHEVADLAARVLAGTLPGALGAATESGGEAVYRLALAWLLCEAAREFHRAERESGRGGLDVLETPEYEALGLPLMLLGADGETEAAAEFPVITQLHLCSAIARAGNLGGDSGARENGWQTADDDLIDAFEFAAIALADGVCAPTQNITDETRRVSGFEGEIAIVRHPLNAGAPATELPENGPVLFVGRLEPRKGTDLFAPAFNRFLSRNPEATVRLVGTDTQWGSTSVRLKITAELEPAVRQRVIFAGEKLPDEIGREFAACRFSICPSLFESYGYVAAESLQAGRAVVVSAGIATSEIVGDAGLCFARGNAGALAEAMESLWRDRALCAELSRRAQVRAAELLDPHKSVDERIAFYERVREQWALGEGKLQLELRGAKSAVQVLAVLQAISALTGTLAGIQGAAEQMPGKRAPGMRLLAVLEKIAGEMGRPAEVLLYGAGRFTARLLAQKYVWESRGHRVAGLIDDHPRFADTGTHLGLPICSIAVLERRVAAGKRIVPIVLCTDTFQEQFWAQTAGLRVRGVPVYGL